MPRQIFASGTEDDMDATSVVSKCVVDKLSDGGAFPTDDESSAMPHYVCRAEYDVEKVCA